MNILMHTCTSGTVSKVTKFIYQIRSDQSLSRVRLFATPWIAVHQASLSITNSRSSPKLMSINLVISSSHLILCRPLLLLPPIPPSIRVFSNESTLRMKWPKYWSFSLSISPLYEHPGLVSFRMDWLDLLEVQGTLKSLLQHHSSKASPNGQYQNQTDYILCSQRWRSCIQSAKTRPGADCDSDHQLLIAKFRLKLKKEGKITRPARYDLNQIPYDYTVAVTNKYNGLDLVNRMPEELWTEVHNTVQEVVMKTIPKKKKWKKARWWLSGEREKGKDIIRHPEVWKQVGLRKNYDKQG